MATNDPNDARKPLAACSSPDIARSDPPAAAPLPRFVRVGAAIILPLLALALIVVFIVGSGMRPSLQGKFVNAAAWHIGLKDENPNGDPQAAASIPPPQSLASKYRVTTQHVNGRAVWMIAPKEGATEKQVLYLHGGDDVVGINGRQWGYLSDLLDRCHCTMTVPDYPYAPQYTIDDGYAMVLPIYKNLIAAAGAGNLTLMGDSAGGGGALALAMAARDQGLPQPATIVLLSPWLDVSMSNPEIPAQDPLDPMLNVQQLVMIGRAWAGKHATTDWFVSPIYGNLDHLAPIMLFIGTHDVFLPDARKFRAEAEAKGIPIEYYEYKNMIHVWMAVTFLPESGDVIKRVSDRINGT